ncbi:MAG: phasin family protein [Pseudomonadota bacterium]
MPKVNPSQFSPDNAFMPFMNTAPLSPMNLKAFNAVTHLNVQMARRMLDMNRQYLDFIQKRLSTDIDYSEKLNQCSKMSEMVETTTSFCKQDFEDYAEEIAELSRRSTDAAAEAVADAEKETRHVLDEDAAKD